MQPCIRTKYSVNPFPVEPLFWQEERTQILALSLDGVPDSCKQFLKPDTKYFLSFFYSAFIYRLICGFEFKCGFLSQNSDFHWIYILMYVKFKEKNIKFKTDENQPCGFFCISLTYLLFISLVQSVCFVIWWWMELENRKFVSDGFDYCVFIKLQEKKWRKIFILNSKQMQVPTLPVSILSFICQRQALQNHWIADAEF